MGPKAFFLILLYLTVLLGILGHLAFVVALQKLFTQITTAIKIASLCRVSQVESDTIRYRTWKAIQEYNKTKTMLNTMIWLSFALTIILGMITLEHLDTLFRFKLCIFLVLVLIDGILVNTVTSIITNENTRYNKRKNDIIETLKAIHQQYPMFMEGMARDETDAEGEKKVKSYPVSVSKLYELIIKRKATRDGEATIEDARNSLAIMAEKGDFEKIFGYLKLDGTLKDDDLIQRSYIIACNSMNVSKKDKYCTVEVDKTLLNSFNKLSNYLPESGTVKQYYMPFYKRVERHLGYAIFVLLLFLLPFFDKMYQSIGPPMIGAITLIFVFGMILMSYA